MRAMEAAKKGVIHLGDRMNWKSTETTEAATEGKPEATQCRAMQGYLAEETEWQHEGLKQLMKKPPKQLRQPQPRKPEATQCNRA